MYTAAVLTQPRNLQIAMVELIPDLEGYLFETPSGDSLPHHMTINMGDFNQLLNNISIKDNMAVLTIDGFWRDDTLGVIAARVISATCSGENIKTVNTHPHITMCLKPGVKPFTSNKLNWNQPGIMLAKPSDLIANITICQ